MTDAEEKRRMMQFFFGARAKREDVATTCPTCKRLMQPIAHTPRCSVCERGVSPTVLHYTAMSDVSPFWSDRGHTFACVLQERTGLERWMRFLKAERGIDCVPVAVKLGEQSVKPQWGPGYSPFEDLLLIDARVCKSEETAQKALEAGYRLPTDPYFITVRTL